MRLTLILDAGNFENSAMMTGEDVASMLAINLPVISESVDIANGSEKEIWDEGKLLDLNGNTVGKWIIKNGEYELHVNQNDLQV